MTSRRFITIGTVSLLTAAAVTVFTGAASARPPAKTAACQYRVCILLLPHTTDADGDGVADVDEVFLGTNGRDPASRPEPSRLIDMAISRQLPSWENHLSELVVLPQLTPDRHGVATGLGRFDIASNPGRLLGTVGAGINGILRNGFDASFGVTVALPSQQGSVSPAGLTAMSLAGRMALVADGSVNGVVGDSNYGVNGGLRATSVTGGRGTAGADGGGRVQEFGYEGGGRTAVHTYSVGYSDGSRDDVQTTQSESTTVTTVSSYDGTGAHTADTTVVTTSGVDASGATTSSVSVTTMLYDEKNNPTGGSQTTTETTTAGNTTTTTVTDQELDANGKPTGPATATVTETTTTECTSSPCPGMEDDLTDPDYVAFGPVTDGDVARVITRLNDSRRPGPDTGDSTPTGPPPSGGRWPLVALINADGVTVLAAGSVPAFNPMQPDYDPRLTALAGISGFPTPSTRDGVTTWS